eukprot:378018-Amphidinium_carterae.1
MIHVPTLAEEAYDLKQQRVIIGGRWVVTGPHDMKHEGGIIGWWWVVKPVQDDETSSPGTKASSRHAHITPSEATCVEDKNVPKLSDEAYDLKQRRGMIGGWWVQQASWQPPCRMKR